MQLSERFDLQKMTRSQVAARKLLDNTPNETQIEALKLLCTSVLEPLWDLAGPIFVNSGFRSIEVNRADGGVDTSQHTKGEAADIESATRSNLELAKLIHDNFVFDQLILEFYDGVDPHSGWVHVSRVRDGNRKQVLRSSKLPNGKTYYAPVTL